MQMWSAQRWKRTDCAFSVHIILQPSDRSWHFQLWCESVFFCLLSLPCVLFFSAGDHLKKSWHDAQYTKRSLFPVMSLFHNSLVPSRERRVMAGVQRHKMPSVINVYLILSESNIFTTVQIAAMLLARYSQFLDEESLGCHAKCKGGLRPPLHFALKCVSYLDL